MALAAKLPKESLDKCHFCKSHIDDPPLLGDKFRIRDIVVHYYCVLLSNGATQKGADEEGLHGFLYPDIKRELQRAKYVKCTYCHEFGAAMECCKCDDKFHLTCGVVRNAASNFKDDFRSYCATHRPRQNIPDDYMQEAKTPPLCVVCQEQVHVWDPQPPRYENPLYQALWAPCCKKTWYHRKCIQRLALSQASLFKCAICSNMDKFRKWVVKYGIYIPERDASWELEEPERFSALLERYCRCDATECSYTQGREEEQEGTMWEILVCGTCGSRGTHKRCSGLRMLATDWDCPDCLKITSTGEQRQTRRSTTTSSAPVPAALEPAAAASGSEASTTETDSDKPAVQPAHPSARRGSNRARRGRRMGPGRPRVRSASSSTTSSSSSEARIGRKRPHAEIAKKNAESDAENDALRPSAAKRRPTRISSGEGSDLDVETADTDDEESIPLARIDIKPQPPPPQQAEVKKKEDQWTDARNRVSQSKPPIKKSRHSDDDVREVAPPVKSSPKPEVTAPKPEPKAQPEQKSASSDEKPCRWIYCQGILYEAIHSADGNIQLINMGPCLHADSPMKMFNPSPAASPRPGPSFSNEPSTSTPPFSDHRSAPFAPNPSQSWRGEDPTRKSYGSTPHQPRLSGSDQPMTPSFDRCETSSRSGGSPSFYSSGSQDLRNVKAEHPHVDATLARGSRGEHPPFDPTPARGGRGEHPHVDPTLAREVRGEHPLAIPTVARGGRGEHPLIDPALARGGRGEHPPFDPTPARGSRGEHPLVDPTLARGSRGEHPLFDPTPARGGRAEHPLVDPTLARGSRGEHPPFDPTPARGSRGEHPLVDPTLARGGRGEHPLVDPALARGGRVEHPPVGPIIARSLRGEHPRIDPTPARPPRSVRGEHSPYDPAPPRGAGVREHPSFDLALSRGVKGEHPSFDPTPPRSAMNELLPTASSETSPSSRGPGRQPYPPSETNLARRPAPPPYGSVVVAAQLVQTQPRQSQPPVRQISVRNDLGKVPVPPHPASTPSRPDPPTPEKYKVRIVSAWPSKSTPTVGHDAESGNASNDCTLMDPAPFMSFVDAAPMAAKKRYLPTAPVRPHAVINAFSGIPVISDVRSVAESEAPAPAPLHPGVSSVTPSSSANRIGSLSKVQRIDSSSSQVYYTKAGDGKKSARSSSTLGGDSETVDLSSDELNTAETEKPRNEKTPKKAKKKSKKKKKKNDEIEFIEEKRTPEKPSSKDTTSSPGPSKGDWILLE